MFIFLAKQMLDFTGCDAVMIGRGVLGNPWLIKECVDYLEDGNKNILTLSTCTNATGDERTIVHAKLISTSDI